MKKIVLGIFIFVMVFVFISNNATVKAQEYSDYEFTLEEITVTAQKREQNQQRVASTMEVITADDIKELGKNNIEEMLSTMSNVIINKASDGLRISLRGISDDESVFQGVQASTPTVSVNQDGVFSDRKDSGTMLYDIERVEVLVGPQSTLYGSNTPGGIINVVTGQPKTDKFEGSGTLELGNYNLLRTEGMVNAPISDTMAVRVAFSTSVHDGYLSNGGDDEDMKSARIKVLYKPTDKFDFTVAYELIKSHAQGITGVDSFIKQSELSDPWDTDTTLPASGYLLDQKKIYANINWNLGFGTLTVVPSYSSHKQHNSETSLMGDGTEVQNTDSSAIEKGAEMRLASSAESKIVWIGGLNYYKREDESLSTSESNSSYTSNSNNAEVKAMYGNITYPFTDRFRGTGGIRYSSDDNDTISITYGPDIFSGEYSTMTDVWPSKYNAPDYKLGMEYDIGDNSMIYADWSTSYRSYGMRMKDTKDYGPEKLKAYTLGSKNRFFDNKFQINAAVYLYNYSNYMPQWQNPSVWVDSNNDGIATESEYVMEPWGPVPSPFRTYGADVQTSTIISNKDKLNLSVSYVKAYFPHLTIKYYYVPPLQDLNFDEKEKTFSPHWTISGDYSHYFNLWNGGFLTARIDARFQTSYNIEFRDEVQINNSDGSNSYLDISKYRVQEAHYIANFSTIYTPPDEKYTFTAYVNNITNYAEKRNMMIVSGSSSTLGTMTLGSPRTYGGILTIKF